MSRRVLKGLLGAAAVGCLIVACGDTSTGDDGGIDPLPQVNHAPSFSTSTEVDLTGDTALDTGVVLTRTLVAIDQDTGAYGVVTYTASAGAPFTISGSTLTYHITDTGMFAVSVVATDGGPNGGLSDTVSWTIHAKIPRDLSKSYPKIEAVVVNPSTGAIHPKLLNKQFVGIVYKRSDSSMVEKKILPAITANFTLWFDTPIDTADSIIIDCFVDSLSDTAFIKPPNTALANLAWPEPACRWSIDSVVCDATGGFGVPFDYRNTINSAKYDISDLYDKVVNP